MTKKIEAKARLLIITATFKYHGTRSGKFKYVQSVLNRIQDWFEVEFEQIAPSVYVTKRRHRIKKLLTIARVIEEELPGATVFLCKKPSARVLDIEDIPYLPARTEKVREPEEITITWEGRIREEHGSWYLSIPKEVKETLKQKFGVDKGSRIRVQFLGKVL